MKEQIIELMKEKINWYEEMTGTTGVSVLVKNLLESLIKDIEKLEGIYD